MWIFTEIILNLEYNYLYYCTIKPLVGALMTHHDFIFCVIRKIQNGKLHEVVDT